MSEQRLLLVHARHRQDASPASRRCRGASLEVAAGRGACADRPERRRQVDDDQDPDRRLPQDAGEVTVRRPAGRSSPRRRRRSARGISTIYQEINLVPYRSVAENIFLGREPRRFGLLDWRPHARARRARCCALRHRRSTCDRPLMSFSTAIQQMVAIARAVVVRGQARHHGRADLLARRARGRGAVRRHPPAQGATASR